MSDTLLVPTTLTGVAAGPLDIRLATLAGRLTLLLGPDHPGADFLAEMAGAPLPGEPLDGEPPLPDPLDRLGALLALSPAELDMIVLAGAGDADEGLAAVLRALHPHGADGATVGLAAALAAQGLLPGVPDDAWRARAWTRKVFANGPLATLVDAGEPAATPFPDRRLALPPGLWAALSGEPGWPCDAVELPDDVRVAVPVGLRAEDPGVAGALLVCAHRVRSTVLVDAAGDPLGAAARLATLLVGAGVAPVVLSLPTIDRSIATAVCWSAAARGRTPVLVPADPTGATAALESVPGPVVLVAPTSVGPCRPIDGRPMLPVAVPPLTDRHRARLWATLLPDLDVTGGLPSPAVDLAVAVTAARDTATAALLGGRRPAGADLQRALRHHRSSVTPVGVHRSTPTVGWSDLVLPADRIRQLHEAVDHIRYQDTVLDRWGFLAGRQGRRGVRLLFAGPPGTGKTLAAEVLAARIGRDLLTVDLSQLVSKWIGETEKNLAAAFDAAERGDAVLLFDEADSLFGRRTEVNDARDRYANLETAYLLSRLSWFDGVAVLTTNLGQNLDRAFTRRLEFVVSFDLPGEDERLQLWRRHLPPDAPLADSVDLADLAERYPVTGAWIRNAAVAAAYLAAAAGEPIGPALLAWAMRREYAKAGKAYPGAPPGIDDPPPQHPLDPPVRSR